ncbi:hypothetical protein [Sideroxydans sp. CL21]|uniref:hypothetical protein n=1 Tax=Sideroxydans sp. CL21 TaxID=2600596 RepID=UPI0024BD33DB|nr:hypothetical protein [Sideroxydans sp. CL21]
MNAPESSTLTPADPAEAARHKVLQQFNVEEIQHLVQTDLLFAQSLAGHGNVWGVWQTPESISPGRQHQCSRNIDLYQRLRDYLAKEPVSSASLDALIEEGALLLTRLALLTRLGQSGSMTARLKPSTVAMYLYQYWPKITARAIWRKAMDPDAAAGLMCCLTDDDVREFKEYKQTRLELERLDRLVLLGLWSDAPPLPDITKTTDPSGIAEARPSQSVQIPHPPIPDEYMAAIGPRVLWVVRDLAPSLLCLLEEIPVFLGTVDWSLDRSTILMSLQIFIADHLQQHTWKDHMGQPLAPPFPLAIATHNKSGHDVDVFEWPPRTWSHLKILSLTLQSAHLFLTLLASAGRIGEVEMLNCDCVAPTNDGKDYLAGRTYKLSGNLFGDAKQWPVPELLVQCLGQQTRLAKVWRQLPQVALNRGLPENSSSDDSLWVSVGTSGGNKQEDSSLNINAALMALAKRVGMDPKPGGKNLHAHRFRKTIGRLAGIALFNSPLVLKRLFGHKSIEMTLHYILCDPDIRAEAENVLRELRIMHCAEALEEIHEAMDSGASLPGNGGPGASRLVQTVIHEQERLKKKGRVWDNGSAHDLAFLLTANGQGWRLIRENIVCGKAPGENGLCQQSRNKGEPNTSNCKPECDNRIVLMRHRRDIEAIAEQYLDIAHQAMKDGQVLVLAHTMDNLREELEAFLDLKEKFLADPAVQALFKYCEEVGA